MAGGSRCECSTDRSRPTWCAGLRSSAWPAGGRALCSPPTLRCRRRAGATPPVNDAQRAVCRRIETDPDAPTRAHCRPTQHSVGAAAAAAPARAGAPPPTTTEMGCELPSRWTSRLTCAARGTQTHRDRSRRSTRARCRPAYTASVRRQIAAPAHGRALGADRRDGYDALDSHRILNREPKLRWGGHRVGPGASGIDNPSFVGGEGDLLVQGLPRALPGSVLGPTSDSWHD